MSAKGGWRRDYYSMECTPAQVELLLAQRSKTEEASILMACMLDDEIRWMLGQWVSGLEPELVFSGSRLIGIGALGHYNPVIRARNQRFRIMCGDLELSSFVVCGSGLE